MTLSARSAGAGLLVACLGVSPSLPTALAAPPDGASEVRPSPSSLDTDGFLGIAADGGYSKEVFTLVSAPLLATPLTKFSYFSLYRPISHTSGATIRDPGPALAAVVRDGERISIFNGLLPTVSDAKLFAAWAKERYGPPVFHDNMAVWIGNRVVLGMYVMPVGQDTLVSYWTELGTKAMGVSGPPVPPR
jgi:hypothetical protein